MGQRLGLVACKGTHQTTWCNYRGDERKLSVLGYAEGMALELVCQTTDGALHVTALHGGENPFPKLSNLRRYLFSKRIDEDAAPEVSTNIYILTR